MTVTTDERSRLARLFFPDGEEPDPRFTLANERTFLAGGIALEAFPLDLSPELKTGLAVFIIAVGMLISAGAAGRWVRVERAMRRGAPLPVPGIVPLLSFAALAASCVAMWLFLTP